MGTAGPYSNEEIMETTNSINSLQATELLHKQLSCWSLATQNYQALAHCEVRTFQMEEGCTIKVQFNPARIISSNAKVDNRSLATRRCFLCLDHLPSEQLRINWKDRYLLLTNPFPIFREHFTLPSCQHEPQSIASKINDLLELTQQLKQFTLFYNGPKCGASAPDHAHFQAATRHVMPLDNESDQIHQHRTSIIEMSDGTLQSFTHYLRNGFIIKARTRKTASELFRQIYDALEIHPDEYEPRMNLFSSYSDEEGWTLQIIPRRQHRPWQYAATGEEQLISSPGAADVGGLFITARPEDFQKINAALLRDIFQQVCLRDEEIDAIAERIRHKKHP